MVDGIWSKVDRRMRDKPAILNAIYNAVGIRFKELPITAEKMLKALKEKNSDTEVRG